MEEDFQKLENNMYLSWWKSPNREGGIWHRMYKKEEQNP